MPRALTVRQIRDAAYRIAIEILYVRFAERKPEKFPVRVMVMNAGEIQGDEWIVGDIEQSSR